MAKHTHDYKVVGYIQPQMIKLGAGALMPIPGYSTWVCICGIKKDVQVKNG